MKLKQGKGSSSSAYRDPAMGDSRRRRSSETQFPGKLHNMMEYVESEGLQDIVSWVMDGRAIKVHDPQKLQSILPNFFNQTRYRSFERQLHMWHFEKLWCGRDRGSFSHPYFIKGNRALCSKMSRNAFDQPLKTNLQDFTAGESYTADGGHKGESAACSVHDPSTGRSKIPRDTTSHCFEGGDGRTSHSTLQADPSACSSIPFSCSTSLISPNRNFLCSLGTEVAARYMSGRYEDLRGSGQLVDDKEVESNSIRFDTNYYMQQLGSTLLSQRENMPSEEIREQIDMTLLWDEIGIQLEDVQGTEDLGFVAATSVFFGPSNLNELATMICPGQFDDIFD